jgi:hypothetical protein
MSSDTHSTPPPASPPTNDFWKHRSFEELSAEQGVKPWTAETWAKMQELANELWPTNEDVDEFIAWVRQIRSEGGEPRELP